MCTLYWRPFKLKYIILSTLAAVIGAIQLLVPDNITAVVNSTVILSCQTDSNSPICWNFKLNSSSTKLSNGDDMNPKFGDRFGAYFDNKTRRSHLIIANVKMTDDGEYLCFECHEYRVEAYVRLTVTDCQSLSAVFIVEFKKQLINFPF